MRIVVLVLALLFFAVPSWATCTTTTANLSQKTIQAAINKATAGDTICLPAGTETWTTTTALTSSVVVNKGITLQGETVCSGTPVTCVDSTVINDGTVTTAGSNPLAITGTNARVTGISFKDPRSVLDSGPNVVMNCASCRFDHNSITQTNTHPNRGMYIISSPTKTQLIDHNYFRDLNGATDVDGSVTGEGSAPAYRGSASWAAPLTPGDANATYMEDNNYDFTAGTVLDGAYDAYSGARLVFRFNTVKSTNMGGHGLDSSQRSTLQQEIYRNTITNLGPAVYTWFQTRGGLHLVFENTIPASGGSYNTFMVITNYRSDGTACSVCGQPLCDGTAILDQNPSGQQGYACRDQVGRGPETDAANDWPLNTSSPVFSQPLLPAYSWGNSYKGSAPTIANVNVKSGASGDNHVRIRTFHVLNNRDFYMEVPSFTGATGTGTGSLISRPANCTTGVAYWAKDQGTWNQASGTPGGQGVLYRCTATNSWALYYTPYTYPHPLQSAQTNVGDKPALSAPQGVTVQ